MFLSSLDLRQRHRVQFNVRQRSPCCGRFCAAVVLRWTFVVLCVGSSSSLELTDGSPFPGKFSLAGLSSTSSSSTTAGPSSAGTSVDYVSSPARRFCRSLLIVSVTSTLLAWFPSRLVLKYFKNIQLDKFAFLPSSSRFIQRATPSSATPPSTGFYSSQVVLLSVLQLSVPLFLLPPPSREYSCSVFLPPAAHPEQMISGKEDAANMDIYICLKRGSAKP